MKQFLFLVFLVVGFSSFVFSQTAVSESEGIEISICQPSLTDAGRQSSFHFNYIYRVISNENGLIEKVTELLDHKKYRGYMNDENVIPCIKNWKLRPEEKYIVTISVGTSGDNYLFISSKIDKIKINL
jgi:hypothetical protein